MLVPVRCFTCGNLIADKFEDYQTKVKSGEEASQALDSLFKEDIMKFNLS
jgi:DNA-directed RNA polymerase subunit N